MSEILGETLKRAYDESMSNDLPDRFSALLHALRSKDGGTNGADRSA